MSYGAVFEVFWEDEEIEPLSDRAVNLALYMITGPHRNAIGCFRLGTGAIMDLPRFAAWGIDGVSIAIQELVDTGFIVRDSASGWTMIVKALKHEPVKSWQQAVSALKLLNRVPQKSPVFKALASILLPQLEPHAKRLEGKKGWPIDTLSIPNPMGMPFQRTENSDQEQDQEQDHTQQLPARFASPPCVQSENPDQLSPACNSETETVPAVETSGWVEVVEPEPEASDIASPPAGLDRRRFAGDVPRAVELWNEMAKANGLSQVQKLTDKRRASIRRRLEDCGGLEGWRAALAKVAGTPGLLGKGKDGSWKIKFNWFISEEKFTDLMEGSYDGWGVGSGRNNDPMAAEMEKLKEKAGNANT